MSLMHPVTIQRLESQVVVIEMKETSDGFHVISAESALIDSLLQEEAAAFQDMILLNQTNEADKVFCLALYRVISSDSNCSFMEGYGLGSEISVIQERVGLIKGHDLELIKELNKKYD
jgi:hypothetical protein